MGLPLAINSDLLEKPPPFPVGQAEGFDPSFLPALDGGEVDSYLPGKILMGPSPPGTELLQLFPKLLHPPDDIRIAVAFAIIWQFYNLAFKEKSSP